MASALVFLHRVGLIPVVVHGAGLFSGERADEVERALRDAMQTLDTDQATTATATSAHSSQTLSPAGRRRLRSQASRLALQEAEAYMHRANSALCTAIEALGVSAAPMLSGCFEAELDEDATGPEAGIIGRIVGVNTAAIHDAVALGSVPVVAALALNPHTHAGDEDAVEAEHGDGTLTFSTWSASEALARDLKPLKIVILRPDGGFLNPGTSLKVCCRHRCRWPLLFSISPGQSPPCLSPLVVSGTVSPVTCLRLSACPYPDALLLALQTDLGSPASLSPATSYSSAPRPHRRHPLPTRRWKRQPRPWHSPSRLNLAWAPLHPPSPGWSGPNLTGPQDWSCCAALPCQTPMEKQLTVLPLPRGLHHLWLCQRLSHFQALWATCWQLILRQALPKAP